MNLPRSLREEKEFYEARIAAEKKYERGESMWIGWAWRLARDPEANASVVPGTNPPLYMVKTADHSEDKAFPVTTFYYRFDDQYVDLVRMKIR